MCSCLFPVPLVPCTDVFCSSLALMGSVRAGSRRYARILWCGRAESVWVHLGGSVELHVASRDHCALQEAVILVPK